MKKEVQKMGEETQIVAQVEKKKRGRPKGSLGKKKLEVNQKESPIEQNGTRTA